MIGWELLAFRPVEEDPIQTTAMENILGRWMGGASWLDRLESLGKAKLLKAGGYPFRYLVRSEDVVNEIAQEVHKKDVRTKIDYQKLAEWTEQEWLMIEGWDQS